MFYLPAVINCTPQSVQPYDFVSRDGKNFKGISMKAIANFHDAKGQPDFQKLKITFPADTDIADLQSCINQETQFLVNVGFPDDGHCRGLGFVNTSKK